MCGKNASYTSLIYVCSLLCFNVTQSMHCGHITHNKISQRELHQSIEMNLLCENGTRCGFILVFIIIAQDVLFKSKKNIKLITLFILFVYEYANVNWGS